MNKILIILCLLSLFGLRARYSGGGKELVANGDFASSEGWDFTSDDPNGFEYVGDPNFWAVATFTDPPEVMELRQEIDAITPHTTYIVTLDAIENNTNIDVQIGGGSTVSVTGTGTQSVLVKTDSNDGVFADTLRIQNQTQDGTGTAIILDNVSVKRAGGKYRERR